MSLSRIGKDEYYLNIALAVSKRSTCIRRHYGCVIIDDHGVIIATGYNGSPRHEENCCDRGSCKRANAERYTNYESCDSVHAEQNALIVADYYKLNNATLYLACEEVILNDNNEIFEYCEDKNPVPCPLCMRMIKNAGISNIINASGSIILNK